MTQTRESISITFYLPLAFALAFEKVFVSRRRFLRHFLELGGELIGSMLHMLYNNHVFILMLCFEFNCAKYGAVKTRQKLKLVEMRSLWQTDITNDMNSTHFFIVQLVYVGSTLLREIQITNRRIL